MFFGVDPESRPPEFTCERSEGLGVLLLFEQDCILVTSRTATVANLFLDCACTVTADQGG
jgi:hypothetical protein